MTHIIYTEESCCGYCCCGMLGPILWICNICLTLVLMWALSMGFATVFLIITLGMFILWLCVICICTSPLLLFIPKIWCAAMFGEFANVSYNKNTIFTKSDQKSGSTTRVDSGIELTVGTVERTVVDIHEANPIKFITG